MLLQFSLSLFEMCHHYRCDNFLDHCSILKITQGYKINFLFFLSLGKSTSYVLCRRNHKGLALLLPTKLEREEPRISVGLIFVFVVVVSTVAEWGRNIVPGDVAKSCLLRPNEIVMCC